VVLSGIRALLVYFNGKYRCVLPSTRGLRFSMKVLGVYLQAPNRFGRVDWLLASKWKDKLAAAGIDPETIERLDDGKLRRRIEQIKDNDEQIRRRRAQRKERDAIRLHVGQHLKPVPPPPFRTLKQIYAEADARQEAKFNAELKRDAFDQAMNSTWTDEQLYSFLDSRKKGSSPPSREKEKPGFIRIKPDPDEYGDFGPSDVRQG
jgi:hypothetical protein